ASCASAFASGAASACVALLAVGSACSVSISSAVCSNSPALSVASGSNRIDTFSTVTSPSSSVALNAAPPVATGVSSANVSAAIFGIVIAPASLVTLASSGATCATASVSTNCKGGGAVGVRCSSSLDSSVCASTMSSVTSSLRIVLFIRSPCSSRLSRHSLQKAANSSLSLSAHNVCQGFAPASHCARNHCASASVAKKKRSPGCASPSADLMCGQIR